MALIHDVIDSDVRFVINPVTRAISNQDSGKLILIRGDHNSERFSFEIPRRVEGHDMSLCNVVRIHYINTDSKTRATSEDIYEPDDFGVGKTDPEVVHFSWLISGNATVYPGSLAFAIEFQCTVGEKVEYAWHTSANSTISIADSITNSVALSEDYSDILTEWWHRIFANSTYTIEMHTMESFAALNGETRENTMYIFEDDPLLEMLARHEEKIGLIDSHETKISSLLSRTSTLNQRIRELQQADADLNAIISQLQGAVNTLQGEMIILSNRILKLENNAGTVTPDEPDIPVDPDEPDIPVDPDEPDIPVDPDEPDEPEDTHTHSYDVVDHVVAATCDTQGYTVYTCECGEGGSENRDYVTALGHNMLAEVVIDATCLYPSYQRYKCSRCDYTYDEQIGPALGHEYLPEVVIDATCEEAAYQVYKCHRCGDTYEQQYAPALGHDWSDAIYNVVGAFEPTCTNDGYAFYKCNNCGKEYGESVPALPHDYEYIEDSSQSSGYVAVCRVCGDTVEDATP